jgi:hypothetical protein
MRTMQVAHRAGVNAQTLRYYERRGLLPNPPRTASGYRAYGPEAVRIVRYHRLDVAECAATQNRHSFTFEIERSHQLAIADRPSRWSAHRLVGEITGTFVRALGNLYRTVLRRNGFQLIYACCELAEVVYSRGRVGKKEINLFPYRRGWGAEPQGGGSGVPGDDI